MGKQIHLEKIEKLFDKSPVLDFKSNKYYNENKDKVKIIQKRYYYNKLSPERKLKYRQKLLENFPDIVDQICCM